MHIKKAPYESGVFSMGWGRIKAKMSHLDGFRAGIPAQALSQIYEKSYF